MTIRFISCFLLALVLGCDANDPSAFEAPHTFVRYYGNASNSGAVGAVPLPSGDLLMGGNSNVTLGNLDRANTGYMLVLKTDSTGAELWRAKIDTTEISLAFGMDVDTNGNTVLCGTTWSEVGNGAQTQLKVAKVSAAGNVLWSRKYGSGTNGETIKIANNGDLLVIGSQSGGPEADIYALRLHAETGDIIWERTYGVANQLDLGVSLDEDASGNIVWLGHVVRPNGQFFRLVKVNALGNVIWDFPFEFGSGAHASADIVATSNTFTAVGSVDNQIVAWQVNSNGNLLWDTGTRLGVSGQMVAGRLSLASGGQFLLAGTEGNDNTSDAMVAKIDGTGKLLWRERYGANSVDIGRTAVEMPSGSLLLGLTIGFDGNSVMALIKSDAEGRIYTK